MRARLFIVGALTSAMLVFAGTAAADPPAGTNAQGCVGEIVSNAAHYWAGQPGPGGLGTVAHDLGVNLGQAIQNAATVVCGKH